MSVSCRNAGDPLVITSFGRSGTHLLLDLTRQQFSAFRSWKLPGEVATALFVPLDEVADGTHAMSRVGRTLLRSRRAIFRSHAWPTVLSRLVAKQPELVEWLNARAQIVHIVRNPKIAIPKLWTLTCQVRYERGVAIDGMDPDAFLTDQAARWASQVANTIESSQKLTIRLEDLIANPTGEILRLGEFVGEKPGLTSPLLVPPHRTYFEARLARLCVSPRSTHVLLDQTAQSRFRFEWSAARLRTLEATAGNAMAQLGYVGSPAMKSPAVVSQ